MGIYILLFSQFYFGKNKVQYRDFYFLTYETERFDIYTEEGSEILAYFAQEVLEEAADEYSRNFGVVIEERIPVIIYNSPSAFSQTNIILEPIEESIGGFTELFKNRVVVPFTGSYKEFKHVLRHELVHIFQFQLFFSLSISNLFSLIPGFVPPLWFMEGMAEYCSEHGGEDASLFMRDLVINGEIIPLSELTPEHGYLLYKEGESFFIYLEEQYGKKKVFEFISAVKFKKGLDEAAKYVFKKGFKEIEEEWMDYLKVKYWPYVVLKKNFKKNVVELTNHKKTGSYFNKSIAISSSGTKIAFISDKEDYTDVYVASAFDGKILKKVITTGRTASFEHLPVLRRGITWSEDERHLFLIAFSQGSPVLYKIDYEKGIVKEKKILPLDDAFSPFFYEDKIVFVGVRDGYSDLYLYDTKKKVLKRLTYDPYEDKDPFYSPQGIFFISDRPVNQEWMPGIYGIFLLKENGEIENIFYGFKKIANPIFYKKNLYFIGPHKALYRLNIKDSVVEEVFSSLATIEEISFSSEGKIAVSFFSGLGWDIGVFKKRADELKGKVIQFKKEKDKVFSFKTIEEEDFISYKLKFSPDYIYGAGGYSTLAGFSGWLNLGISDMLGDHRIYVNTYLLGDISFSNFIFEYWYLPRRWDIGVAAYQLVSYYYLLPYYDILIERYRGGALLFSYPFSKFRRVELEMDGMWVDEYLYLHYDDEYYPGRESHYPLWLAGGAFVFDNILWRYYTPMRGTRWRASGYTTLFSSLDFKTFYIDFRHYIKLTPRSAFAIRMFGGKSIGKDAEYFIIGGTGSVRGYSEYESIGHNVVFTNLEVRVPFIDYLKMAFPIPLTIKNLRGVVFADGGVCWSDSLNYYDPSTQKLGDIKIGYGAGLRFIVSYFLFKIDFAWPFFYSETEDYGMKIHFSIGADF